MRFECVVQRARRIGLALASRNSVPENLTGDPKYLLWARAGVHYIVDHAVNKTTGNVVSYWSDGKPAVGTGFFLTIWKRQPDGSWRYVMDNGAPDRPAPNKVETPTPKKPEGETRP